MIRPPPNIVSRSQAPPPKPSSEPVLRWPSFDDTNASADLERFPTIDQETRRRGAGLFGAHSRAFMDVVRGARERIWVIDSYLFKMETTGGPCFSRTFETAFLNTEAFNIQLIASDTPGLKEQLQILKNVVRLRSRPGRQNAFQIEVRLVRNGRSSVTLPHDRFAIIDDELWHCGANVGGTHYEVNAYSRGWSATEKGALDYFDWLWRNAGAPQ